MGRNSGALQSLANQRAMALRVAQQDGIWSNGTAECNARRAISTNSSASLEAERKATLASGERSGARSPERAKRWTAWSAVAGKRALRSS